MCVIYMMSEDTKAIKDHGRLLLYRKEEKIASQPISRISSVVVTKQAHITMPLVYALLEEGVPISYMDFRGRVLGVLGGERISLEHLFRQKEVMERPKEQIRLVREIVCRKIGSQRRLLKEYSYRERELQAMAALGRLTAYAHKAEYLMDIEELRGMEGAASRVYFAAFPCLLDEKLWRWEGRAQHPAHDAVNALLNYGYAFLEKEVRIALAGSGLDARLGFFHANNGRKDSLVYDMMEPYRHDVLDRLVLKLLRGGSFAPDDFSITAEECRLSSAAKKIWAAHYENYMEKPRARYDGLSPREMIRREMEAFGAHILRKKKEGDEV